MISMMIMLYLFVQLILLIHSMIRKVRLKQRSYYLFVIVNVVLLVPVLLLTLFSSFVGEITGVRGAGVPLPLYFVCLLLSIIQLVKNRKQTSTNNEQTNQ